jgi:crotonobetainyl-CoA:carnitine CoA-transferase CaiB-like acyl-CoA transferase
VDWTGGYVAALSLVVGVHAARRDGIGMDCDVSLFDTAVTMLNYPAAWHLNAGYTPARTRHSSHPSLVPFGNFQAADGWLVVACPKEKFWRLLVKALELHDVAVDPRFADFGGRRANRDALLPLLEERFRARPVAEWLELLGAAGVPVAPINSVADALADDHTRARGLVVETDHPRFGSLRTLASPVRVGDPAALTYRRGPARHEDADRILREVAGYDDRQIRDLTSAGAFGDLVAGPDGSSVPAYTSTANVPVE